jgi:hypothetical protein
LDDIASVERIRAVVANGRLYESDEIRAMLGELQAGSSRTSIATLLRIVLDEEGVAAARTTLERLGRETPDSVRATVWDFGHLGHELVVDDRHEEARAIFAWGMEAHPTSPFSYALYAYGLERMDRAAEAAAQWARAAAVADREEHPSQSHFRAKASSAELRARTAKFESSDSLTVLIVSECGRCQEREDDEWLNRLAAVDADILWGSNAQDERILMRDAAPTIELNGVMTLIKRTARRTLAADAGMIVPARESLLQQRER